MWRDAPGITHAITGADRPSNGGLWPKLPHDCILDGEVVAWIVTGGPLALQPDVRLGSDYMHFHEL